MEREGEGKREKGGEGEGKVGCVWGGGMKERERRCEGEESGIYHSHTITTYTAHVY